MNRQLSLLLAISLWTGLAWAAPQFQISTIQSGDVRQQTVFGAYLDDRESAELLLVTVDRENQRKLRLFEMNDGTYPALARLERSIASDVILMDVGTRGDKQILVWFTRNTAWQYDPYTNEREKLIRFSSIYRAAMHNSLPKMDLFRDLNDDGLDDFIIPGFEGFQLYLQDKEGEFSGPYPVNAPPMVEMTYTNSPSYQPKTNFLADVTLDGRKDLVFWIDDRFSIYPQTINGTFSAEPFRMKPEIKIDYEGPDAMSVSIGGEDQSDNFSKALFRVTDLNGDQLADLVTLSVKSKGVFRKTSTYEFHTGSSRDGLVEFSPVPGSRIESNGIQFDMQEKDFNNDGQKDMVISTVELGIGKILGALLTGSINIDLNFYQMEDGKYPAKPDLTREVTATFSLSTGDVFFPSVLLADIDGDGGDDLLVQSGSDTLKIYLGGQGSQLFAKKSTDINVHLPNEPDLFELADLNADGKKDLILRHQNKSEPSKVVVMVSR